MSAQTQVDHTASQTIWSAYEDLLAGMERLALVVPLIDPELQRETGEIGLAAAQLLKRLSLLQGRQVEFENRR